MLELRPSLLRLGVTAALACGAALPAQELLPSEDSASSGFLRIKWPLVDFVLHADSARGLWLYASPNLLSVQGDTSQGHVDVLCLDPPTVRKWTETVHRLLENRAPLEASDSITFPLLADTSGRSFVSIGVATRSRFFVQVNGSGSRAWRAFATAQEVAQLLEAFAHTASRSALRPGPTTNEDGVVEGGVRVPPELLRHPPLRYPLRELRDGRQGRVWLEFVIDTLGRPETNAISIVLSDGKGFAHEALNMIRGAEFRPARVSGRLMRVLVVLPVTFRLPR